MWNEINAISYVIKDPEKGVCDSHKRGSASFVRVSMPKSVKNWRPIKTTDLSPFPKAAKLIKFVRETLCFDL